VFAFVVIRLLSRLQADEGFRYVISAILRSIRICLYIPSKRVFRRGWWGGGGQIIFHIKIKRQTMYYNVTLRRVREPLLLWKSHKYLCVRVRVYLSAWACACACVYVALLIQHATRMRHVVTSFVTPLAPPCFSTLTNNLHDFRKKVIEHKMCVLILSTTFI
jgi:hypothetical protein